MAVITAPPRPAPARREPVAAAPLRVVSDAELRDARRRVRNRRLVAVASALVVAGLFGVVVAHVLLMQGQFELQQLQTRSADSQADYDRLRLQVSELESPNRIVAAAQEKLGMVAPAKITYLAPTPDATPVVAAAAATMAAPPGAPRAPAAASAAAAAPPARWTSVKPHLAES